MLLGVTGRPNGTYAASCMSEEVSIRLPKPMGVSPSLSTEPSFLLINFQINPDQQHPKPLHLFYCPDALAA